MQLKLIISGVIICSAGLAQAQYAEDVLRYSQTGFGGTARIQGVGGAQVALGGDISSLQGNPAGLAFYRRSDFSISPSLRFGTTEATYFGQVSQNNRDKFTIPNLGVVFAQPFQNYRGQEVTDGWSSFAFGIGINRLNNFNQHIAFTGKNTGSSITQYFAELANDNPGKVNEEGTYEYMAYNTYLINPTDSTQKSFTGASSGNVTQSQSDKISGAHTEWNVAGAINYSNKLFLGGSLDFSSITYDKQTNYIETGMVDTLNNVTSMDMVENLLITGGGVNVKGGMIWRPVNFIRFGAMVQSPTYIALTESFQTSMSSTFGNNDSTYSFHDSPYSYNFDYSIRTPARYNLGMAMFFQKLGFISADIEQVDYSLGTFSSDYDASFNNEQNKPIKENFASTLNYRLGAEARIGMITLRGGYAYYGDPYENKNNVDRSRKSVTAGLGFKSDEFYVDFAFVNTYYNSLYSPYSTSAHQPVASIKHDVKNFMFTIGSKF